MVPAARGRACRSAFSGCSSCGCRFGSSFSGCFGFGCFGFGRRFSFAGGQPFGFGRHGAGRPLGVPVFLRGNGLFSLEKTEHIRFTLFGYFGLLHGRTSHSHMKKHVVRIVGGDYRKTPITVLDAPGLRPTPDRVRETLFNWLHHFWGGRFDDKRVLDLFAGTGALGFEAASRGAAHVQMVESNPAAVAALRALRTRLNAQTVRIHAGDAGMVLKRLNGRVFDLVMLDPPFGQGWLERLWEALPPILAPDGLLYIEAEAPVQIPAGFEVLRQSRAGNVHFHLLRICCNAKNIE